MKDQVAQLQNQFQHSSPAEVLRFFLDHYQTPAGRRIAFASSLGAEDQVVTDLLLKIDPGARIFTLDTGRLPQETYQTIAETMKRYGMRYEIYFPDTAAVEKLTREFGPDLFYESIERRKLCCKVRKIEPLRRALQTVAVWITGLRREQSITRTGIRLVEWDEENQVIKLNPLADWTADQVWSYIRENAVPYNPLHDLGYPSIGCAPCTRSIRPDEDIRAGRWWWEEPQHKECGLHYRDGKLARRMQHESA